MSNVNTRRKFYGIAGMLLMLAVPFFIGSRHSGTHLESQQSLCPMKLLTGFPCPGCGITKSMVFFYEGNISKSLQHHVFGPITVLFCLAGILLLMAELLTRRDYLRSWFYSKKLAYVLGISLAGYHLVRLFYFVSDNNFYEILAQSVWR